MEQPITRNHERFGTLTFDPELDKYEADVVWHGSPLRLTLYAVEDMELENALKVAEQLWEDQDEWNQRVEAYTVEKLLNLKNTTWLEDDEEEVSPEIFKSRIRLETITVSPKGFLGFWYDEGDLFFGHVIHVEGSLQHGLTNARIEV